MNNTKANNIDNCYYPLHIPEARDIIERESRAALHRKYGDDPHAVVTERFNKELEKIDELCAEDYYVAYLIAKKCDELGFVHSLRGCGGSSFIAYLLGITEVNPLPPHYYCPECGHVECVDEYLFPLGTDLNNVKKECPACGSKMRGDGQNSPWEFFLGFEGDKVPDFVFNVPSRNEIFDYLVEGFGKDKVFNDGQITNGKVEVQPGRIILVPEDVDVNDFAEVLLPGDKAREDETYHGQIVILDDRKRFPHIDVLENKVLKFLNMMQKRTGIPAKGIYLRGGEIMDLLEYGDIWGFPFERDYAEKVKNVIDSTHPTSYTELLKIYGNVHGTGVWENNNEILCRGYTLHEMIAFREDVMLSLIRWGVEYKDAFALAESVRKGKVYRRHEYTDEEIETLINSRVPGWYVRSMEKIQYLFPKVHAVEYMNMYVRAIWYKKHYYDDYVQVMQDDLFADYML
jgi:DNA polymerase-3 subunit alpha (Gram-positive type)